MWQPLVLLLPALAKCLDVIMFVPGLSYSHVAFNAAIARKMTDSGHRVLMVLMMVDHDVHFNHSSFEVIRKYVGIPDGHARRLLWENPNPFEDASPTNPRILLKFARISNLFVWACHELMLDINFLEMLSERKFDVGMVEQYDACGFSLFSEIGVKDVIWLSATNLFRSQVTASGTPRPLSYVPELFLPSVEALGFWNRLNNVIVAVTTELFLSFTHWRQTRGIDLRKVTSGLTVISNSGYGFEEVAPTFSSISPILGVTLDNLNYSDCDAECRRILNLADSALDGFVIVSFGSIAKTSEMPDELRNPIFTAMSRLPELTFIMKWETNNTSNYFPPNVFPVTWLPQKHLADHHNFRAMFTHGGWSSILEVTNSGKPLILLPLFADHWQNARIIANAGAAVVLEKGNVNSKQVTEAIRHVTSSKKVQDAAKRLSSILNSNQPASHSEILDFRLRSAGRFRKGEKFRISQKTMIDFYLLSVFVFALVSCVLAF